MAYVPTTKKTVQETNALKLFVASTALAILIGVMGGLTDIPELITGAIIVWIVVGALCYYALTDEIKESNRLARENLKKNIKRKYDVSIMDATGTGELLQGDAMKPQPIQIILKDEAVSLLVEQQTGTYEPFLKDLAGLEAKHLLKQNDFF